jgi:Ca2+-binding RTX toxin-like protein
MALIVGTPSTFAVGNAFTLLAGDNFILPAGIVAVALDGHGLFSSTGDHTITVMGTLYGLNNDGIRIGDTNLASFSTISIVAGATVVGADDAIELASNSGTINNAGLLTGNYGMSFYTSLSTGIITINNSGKIISEQNAIHQNSQAKVSLLNTGTIQSYDSNSYQSFNNSIDVITNKGVMFGDVQLGSNADTYDGRGGRVGGSVFGLDGADKLTGGDLSDTFVGGSGIDVLTGGKGKDSLLGGSEKDTFDFNAVIESGTSSSTRDVIQDFVHNLDKIDLSTIDANTATAVSAFGLLAKGTATSVVGSGKIGWYQINAAGVDNDMTILRINNDADASIEMTIQLRGLIALTSVDFVL